MDLSVLHLVQAPDRDYRWKDRLNSYTSHRSCLLLEWTGWYNQDIYQRLLGHYRLYQDFKNDKGPDNHLSSVLSYITNYKRLHIIKYGFSSLMAFVYYLFGGGKRYKPVEVEGINRLLITINAKVLQEFLQNAEQNFSFAIAKAVQQVNNNSFLNTAARQFLFVQKNCYDQKHYETNSHYFNEYHNIQTAAGGVKGKEKGVFSKKQLLIFFDLLAEAGTVEKIDYSKPNKFDGIAAMLQAISGKSKESWLEQLKDTKNRELYSFQNVGELSQLIITLTNLSDTFRKAGLRKVTAVADKKLRELQKIKANTDADTEPLH